MVTKEGVLRGSKGNTLVLDDVFIDITHKELKDYYEEGKIIEFEKYKSEVHSKYLNKKVRAKGYLQGPGSCPEGTQCKIEPTLKVEKIEIID